MGEANKTNNYTDSFYKTFRNILLVSIPLVVISAIILDFIPHSSASTDQIEFSLSVSCTMSSVVNSAHAKEITNGTYHSGVGKTTITALCNDGNGYTVYATGYGNNEEGNNKLINSSYPQYSIDTGLATSGLTSQWAMKLSNIPDDPSSTPPIIESAYDNTYGLVPDNWTKVASRQSGTTDMNLGSSFTTTYSIYTSSSQFAGTYRGQVKYALLHPYKNDNVMSLEDSFALFGKNKVAVTDPITGQTGSYYKMQDMESGICNSTNVYGEASATQLVDIRDNKLYWVAKLNDEHCWMTQNLSFNINTNTTLNSQSTDLNVIYDSSTGQYLEYNDGYTVNNNVVYWSPVSNSVTISFSGNDGAIVSDWQDSNTIPYSAKKTDSIGTGHASLGNYYNWTAAIASNNSSSLTQDTISDITKNSKNSICSKGWRLPTISDQPEASSGSTNEFARLSNLYTNNFTIWKASPLFFFPAGAIERGKYLANGMRYSSSTLGSDESVYFMQALNNYAIQPSVLYDRGFGRSVRCVAR